MNCICKFKRFIRNEIKGMHIDRVLCKIVILLYKLIYRLHIKCNLDYSEMILG